MRIPETGLWKQSISPDTQGDVVDTCNCDFDDEGYLALSERMALILSGTDDTDFARMNRFLYFDNTYWAITDDEVFRGDITTLLTQDGDANSPNDGTDAEFFNGHMYVSSNSTGTFDLDYRNASTNAWVTLSLSFPSGITAAPMPLKVFKNLNKMAIGTMNKVSLLKTDNTLDATVLTLPTEFVVTSIDYNNNQIYIGTWNTQNDQAYLFIWDGSDAAADFGFPVGASQIFSVKTYLNSVVLTTSAGQLLRFAGNGFETLGNFPIYYKNQSWIDTLNFRKGFHRSMVVDGDVIFISIDAQIDSGIQDFLAGMRSGLWCYDPKVGLHLKYSYGSSHRERAVIGTASTNTTDDELTVSAGIYAAVVSGTPVMYDAEAGTPVGGLADKGWYYVIKSGTANRIKLATTRVNALAGTAINLTGTGNDSQTYHFYPEKSISDEGAERTQSVEILPSVDSEESYYFKRIAAAAQVRGADGSSSTESLQLLVPNLPNVGYFITRKFTSPNATDQFISVITKFRGVNTVDDKIIIKYRTTDSANIPILTSDVGDGNLPTGTIVSSTSFTSVDPSMQYVLAGDEITIMAGSGGGHVRHVSSITNNAGTYTITLTEALPQSVAAETMFFRVERWTVLETITSSTEDGLKMSRIGKPSKFLQLKYEMRGVGIKIESIDVVSDVNKPLQ